MVNAESKNKAMNPKHLKLSFPNAVIYISFESIHKTLILNVYALICSLDMHVYSSLVDQRHKV